MYTMAENDTSVHNHANTYIDIGTLVLTDLQTDRKREAGTLTDKERGRRAVS